MELSKEQTDKLKQRIKQFLHKKKNKDEDIPVLMFDDIYMLIHQTKEEIKKLPNFINKIIAKTYSAVTSISQEESKRKARKRRNKFYAAKILKETGKEVTNYKQKFEPKEIYCSDEDIDNLSISILQDKTAEVGDIPRRSDPLNIADKKYFTWLKRNKLEDTNINYVYYYKEL